MKACEAAVSPCFLIIFSLNLTQTDIYEASKNEINHMQLNCTLDVPSACLAFRFIPIRPRRPSCDSCPVSVFRLASSCLCPVLPLPRLAFAPSCLCPVLPLPRLALVSSRQRLIPPRSQGCLPYHITGTAIRFTGPRGLPIPAHTVCQLTLDSNGTGQFISRPYHGQRAMYFNDYDSTVAVYL